MQFNFTTPWGQLREACLGTVYPTDFFATVVDSTVRSGLERILHETIEDLDHIETTLKSLDIVVHRPQVSNVSIKDFVDIDQHITRQTAGSNSLIPRPPLQVRDSFFVCGNQLYQTRCDGPYVQAMIDSFGPDNCHNLSDKNFDAPLVTVLNERVYVDTLEIPTLDQTVREFLPNKQIISVATGGHNDAVFAVLKPGVLITLEDPALYKDTFPGWNILSIPTQSWRALKDFRKLKVANGGRWWSPDASTNPEFVGFVNTWLDDWVGFAQETVFDVNCLVVNDRLVLVNNHNAEVEAFLKQNNMDCIVTPLRHRFFWDGGIHCVTNDLVRTDK